MADRFGPNDPRSTVGKARERVMQAKRRELAAHKRAVVLHQQAAELQRRLGHPARAQAAWQRAERAQGLHDLALTELLEWDLRAAQRHGAVRATKPASAG
jgi:hypothetical protein